MCNLYTLRPITVVGYSVVDLSVTEQTMETLPAGNLGK